jgi:hypothetical protein
MALVNGQAQWHDPAFALFDEKDHIPSFEAGPPIR